MKKAKAIHKPAQSFRLGEEDRLKLVALSEYREEPQVEVLRTLIGVGYRAMMKRKVS